MRIEGAVRVVDLEHRRLSVGRLAAGPSWRAASVTPGRGSAPDAVDGSVTTTRHGAAGGLERVQVERTREAPAQGDAQVGQGPLEESDVGDAAGEAPRAPLGGRKRARTRMAS